MPRANGRQVVAPADRNAGRHSPSVYGLHASASAHADGNDRDPLDLAQLRHVFLHELAHLKRFDIAVGLLTAVVQTVHWFNPLVWLAFRRMRDDREVACDDPGPVASRAG